MSEPKIFDFNEESQSERLARKSKETPFFPIGKYFFKLIADTDKNDNSHCLYIRNMYLLLIMHELMCKYID